MVVKRDRVTSDDEGGARASKYPRLSSPGSSAPDQPNVALNKLCSECRSVLSFKTTNSGEHLFHTFPDLKSCAEKECHLCALLLQRLEYEATGKPPSRVPIKLKARLLPKHGISMILCLPVKDAMPVVATFDLVFPDSPLFVVDQFITGFPLKDYKTREVPGKCRNTSSAE